MASNIFIIPEHAPIRNIPRDGLKGVELARSTVIFGINGSGKTTVANLLGRFEPGEITTEDGNVLIENVLVFDSQWVESTIGDLVRGHTGPGIVKTVLGKENVETKKQLDKKLEDESAISNEIDGLAKSQTDWGQKKDACIDRVKSAIASEPRNRKVGITATAFNKKRIEDWLQDSNKNHARLSESELNEKYELLGMDDVRVDTFDWDDLVVKLGATVVKEICEGTLNSTENTNKIDEWVREGLERHQHRPGTNCDFCGNIVTEGRIKELLQAISVFDNSLSEEFFELKEYTERAYETSVQARRRLDGLVMNDPTSKKEWAIKRAEAQRKLTDAIEYIEAIKNSIDRRAVNPGSIDEILLPDELDLSDVNRILNQFCRYNDVLRRGASLLSEKKEKAKSDIKSHYVSAEVETFSNIFEQLSLIDANLKNKRSQLLDLQKDIEKLKRELTSSAPVAHSLTQSLCAVLGDSSLKVEAEHDGQYTIRRSGAPAEFMSEGEKKMLALMYFLETLDSEEVDLSKTIVVLDDVGAELDESRLIYMDDLIVQTFAGKVDCYPASVIYTTHSFYYFRYLIERLYDARKKDKSRFYEAYKGYPKTGGSLRPTMLRRWEDHALAFPTEYLLTFNAVVVEALRLLEYDENSGHSRNMSPFVGNHCRKVLETFTEFKHPHHPKFGVRLTEMCTKYPGAGSGALSKLANSPSHAGLSRESSYWSNETIKRLVLDTLRFIKCVDEDHFEKMVKRVTKGDGLSVAGPEGFGDPLQALECVLRDAASE